MAKIRRKRAGISFSISVTVFILRLIKQQSVVTHTIRQTETPALPDSWATNTSSVKMLCQKKKIFFSLDFLQNTNMLKCWSINDLSNVCLSSKTVYQCVTTNCCSANDIFGATVDL